MRIITGLTAILIAAMFIGCGSGTTTTTKSPSASPKATPRTQVSTIASPKEPAPIIFDIPSLVGKSIDEIREILGKPQDKEPEPTELQLQIGIDEWSNVFSKDGQELVVTFNPRTRRVTDFFLVGEDETILMQLGNLAKGTPAYRIEPVKQIRNPSKITGIKIIPT